jgi:hypothetical protein
MNEFWGVSFSGRDKIISVITGNYGRLLEESAPDFYSNFSYSIFFSPMTFSELNARLPFFLLRDADEYKIVPVDQECLAPGEIEHIKIHREILDIYRENQLEPLPPWHHISEKKAVSEPLSRLVSSLEEATELFLASSTDQ